MTTIHDVADAAPRLTITVVSDFICPWCYVGLETIERVWKTYDIDLDWAPYFLDPTIPPEGRSRKPTPPETPQSPLEVRAEALGLEMRRDRTFTPHTHLSLQASEFAHRHGDTATVIEYHRRLFKAYFTDLEDLMDPEVLVRHAEAVGLDGTALRAALADGSLRAAVDEGIQESYEIGIQGIPTFLLNGQYAIVGAHEFSTFEQVMERLGVPRRDAAASASS